MGYGILEPSAGTGHVPGTVQLFDDKDSTATVTHQLKHGTGADSNLVLAPQPSDSPNDPLNWPLWKRDLTLFILCLAGSIAGVVGPAIAPINGVLVKEFHTTYKEVAKWSGWQFWSAGVAGLIASAAGRIWGKRPIYLFSIVLVFAGAIWNAATTTKTGFLVSRTIQGFGLGAFETIIPSSIGDMYYVHERGKRVAAFNLAFLGSTYFMPILGGYISMRHGWRAQFEIISAFMGAALVLAFFLLPEHVYNRADIFNTDTASTDNLQEIAAHRAGVASTEPKPEPTATTTAIPIPVSVEEEEEAKKTWIQQLSLYNGRFSPDPFWRLLLAPLVLLCYPATLWSFLFQGTFITWGIGVSIILAQLFAGPPTNFGPEKLGYMYAFPFLGALCSFFLASFLSDRIATRLARRNNNIYEPEFRILLVIPTACVALPGLFAFGYTSDHTHGVHWVVPSLCYGLITFGVVMSCTATFSYVLDAHRDISLEMMVSLLLIKNLWAYGSTFFLNDWVKSAGPAKVFNVIGGIQAGICAVSVLMYMFGKRQRAFFAKWNLLKMTGLYPKKVEDVGGH